MISITVQSIWLRKLRDWVEVHTLIGKQVLHPGSHSAVYLSGSCDAPLYVSVPLLFQNNENVNIYFSACDVVVLPYKKASQSGVIPISFNYNKLILVSNIAGLKEFVISEKTGYLFENKNSDSLFETLNKICFDHDFNKSYKYIDEYKKKYTIEKLANDILAFIV